jgi:cyclopropane fatty-acyl-phospholipid synthase-like methyltransferase
MSQSTTQKTEIPFAKRLAARLSLPVMAKRKTYQPVSLGGVSLSRGARETYVRWNEIEKVIAKDGIKTVLDIGCAEGFFIRKCVEKGCFATGVDADPEKLLWANTTLALDGLDGFSFTKLEMSVDNLHLLPASDLVINLSVMHHFMYMRGEDYALEFMKKLKSLTKKVMIFEMGQSDETHYPWAKQLPDMGANPHQWIESFLRRCGFAGEIRILCKAKSHKDAAERAIFAAYV